ncbi:mfs dha1 multidrug resistance [Micractinium conductrix]|uniref:Mfs dha1 multidrug resistance n=1 Tax=Micractinium conductrix TaxID=554055 RepID=A0A2P6VH19_9CHLO|nr:mfs dha1 multidrug resistance [Micractinium conductrix]|eukprot:PSC73377.1 mfs dha1 multidrug resistance [Micractinium conductrix]
MLAQDWVFSMLALALWCITSVKSALTSPLLAKHNLQSLAGAAAIACVGLGWPAVAPRSYVHWRVPALAFVRAFLLLLPYNFEEGIWDEVFPGSATGVVVGPLAWLSSLSHLAVGTGLVLLVLTALGWRLPLCVHMPLQAVLVFVWIHFGTAPHSRNKLMRSPEVAPAVSLVFNAGELATAVLLPIAAQPPGGPRTQAASFLLYMWLLLGWLLPTLLLMHPVRQAVPELHPAAGQQRRSSGGCGNSSNSSRAKRWLAAPDGAAVQQRARVPRHDDVSPMVLPVRWLTLLVLLWWPCRVLAPLYAREGTPLSPQGA